MTLVFTPCDGPGIKKRTLHHPPLDARGFAVGYNYGSQYKERRARFNASKNKGVAVMELNACF